MGIFQSITNMVVSTIKEEPKKGNDKPQTSSPISDVDTKEMVQLMDWTYDKSNEDIQGLGTSKEMAEEYLKKKDGDVNAAVNALIKWQILTAAKSSILQSLGNIPNLNIKIPDKSSDIIAIQMRMVQAIAYMGGCTDLKKLMSGTYLSLLGTDAGSILTSVLGKNYSVDDLSDLDLNKLQSIKEQVSNKILTKLHIANKKDLSTGLRILTGIVGGSVDALATYSIAAAAKSIFLKDNSQAKQHDDLEEKRMQVLINMAMVDGMYSKEEGDVLKKIVSSLLISDKTKQRIFSEIDSPKQIDIDLSEFKKDPILSKCLISTLEDVLKADGKSHPSEQQYFDSIKNILQS